MGLNDSNGSDGFPFFKETPRLTSKRRRNRKTHVRAGRPIMEPMEGRLMLAAHTAASRIAIHAALKRASTAAKIAKPVASVHFAAAVQGTVVTSSAPTNLLTIGTGAAFIDSSLTVTANAGATFSSATVQFSQGYHGDQDQLALTGVSNATGTFDSTSGVLTINFSTAFTAAQVQSALRAVTYAIAGSTVTLDPRQVTFSSNGATSNDKTLQLDTTIDADTQSAVTSAFNLIQNIGQKVTAFSGTPGLNDKTAVPYTKFTVTDLLYPNQEALDSNGNAVANYGASVQPQQIGGYLALKSTVISSFAGSASLVTLQNNIKTALSGLVPGTSAVRDLTSSVAANGSNVSMVLTITNTKGSSQPLDLGALQAALGLYLPTPPTVSVGGGADIRITVSIDLTGHTAGNALANNKIDINFQRFNSLAGFSYAGTTDAEIGVIRGKIVNGSGAVGASIPVTLTGGSHRTLDRWTADGSNASGFGAITGSINLNLPITAAIGGVSATTANTKIVVTDTNIFDTTAPTYTTTDFSHLQPFSTMTPDGIIQEILRAGTTIKSIGNAAGGPLGVQLPFVKATTVGGVLQTGKAFDQLIGTQVDLHQPTLKAAKRDALTDWRLPLSTDTTPKPSAYSDLLGGFQFGVIVNNQRPVKNVTVAANANRNTLSDLVTDLNAAFTTANVNIAASNQNNTLAFTATNVSVQSFTFVAAATANARQNPASAPTDATGLTTGQTYYYSVTGATGGTVKGTNYYTLDTPIATAAVHAGLLANGASGVVKLTMVGNKGSLWDSTRHGISSSAVGSSTAAYLIESADSDLKKLGLVDSSHPLPLLESVSGGHITATMPFAANLSGAAKLVVTLGGTAYTVNVADNNRSTLTVALTDVQNALVTAGLTATNLAAQLVDAQGNPAPDPLVANTNYFLQLYLPTTNGSATLTVTPNSDPEAYKVLPLGFTVGQVASQPRPMALRTFEDFQNATLFPNLTITPTYDNVHDKVTLAFSVSQTNTGTATAANFDFKTAPLSNLSSADKTLTLTIPSTTALDFGLEFNGTDARLRNPTDGNPIIRGTVVTSLTSFAGSVKYGFNTLNFTQGDASLSFRSDVRLNTGADVTTQQLANDPTTYLSGTMTGSDGTGHGTGLLNLAGISAGTGQSIASNASIQLGMSDLTQTTVTAAVPLDLPIPVPQAQTNGKLDNDATINFIQNRKTYSLTVAKSPITDANTTFSQLITQFNAALHTASVTTGSTTVTGQDVSSQFVISDKDGLIQVSAYEPQQNPGYATVSFLPTLSAFGEIGLQGAFGPGTVADALQSSLTVLDNMQSGAPLVSQFALPLVNQNLAGLLDIKGSLLSKIGTFRGMDITSASQIATSLAAVLNVPSNQVNISFDAANSAYRVDVQYETGTTTTLPLDMSLADLLAFTGGDAPEGLSRLVDTGNHSPLKVTIGATTVLSIGIDLTDPANPRAFLYGHDASDNYVITGGTTSGTSVKYDISIKGDGINFSTSTGALGVFVEGGSVSLAGPATLHSGAPVYTYDGANKVLHLVTDTPAADLKVQLGTTGGRYYLTPHGTEADANSAANFQAHFDGSLDVNLPLFTPTEYTNPFTNRTETVYINGAGNTLEHPGGNVVDLKVTDLGAFADDSLTLGGISSGIAAIYAASSGTLTSAQQAVVTALNNQKAAIVAKSDVTAFVPDPTSAETGVNAPTLLDTLRDPSILLDGLDSALGLVQTGLQGLDNLNIPVIGPVLGDAVKNVFSFRSGWLNDMKHRMRGAGENAFEIAKQEIFNFLGPAGLNILLQENGIQSVSGFVPAQSADDVTFDFLDKDGHKMTGLGGLGAQGVEFKVRLGQTLVDTGVNLGFNFDSLAPALSLGIKGGLSFKLGWDMTLGFGFSMKDGFFLDTTSDATTKQLELRFDAGLTGADTGFTVAARTASHTGFSIKDADGNWLLGPKNGDGSQSILDVMSVNHDGAAVDTTSLTPAQIAATECDQGQATVAAADKIYWVVAADNGGGTWTSAHIDRLGFYRGMTGTPDPTKMVQFNQTAPFAAFGSLFFLNLKAIDNIQTGLDAKGDEDYHFSTEGVKAITSYGRNNAEDGVNRNNSLPTRFSGSIGVKLIDPSAAAKDYVARPGPTSTGFMEMDGSSALGGTAVKDDKGRFTPVKMIGGVWTVMKLEKGVLVADHPMTEDDSPNRITFQEIKDEGIKLFKVSLDLQAVVNLHLTLSVSSNANFPKITADLNLDWQHSFVLLGGEDTGGAAKAPTSEAGRTAGKKAEQLALLPEVGVNDIRLDLGSFLTKLIKPIIGKIDDGLQPVDKLIAVINHKIPVISDIAGHDVTLTTLLNQFGGPEGKAVAAVIDAVQTIGDLATVMAHVPDNANVYLPLGNFWLAKISNGPLGRPGEGTTIYYDNSEVHAPSITQQNQSLIADPGAGATAATDALGSLDSASNTGGSGGEAGNSGFDIPLLNNPMTVFKLLMGQDVPLVTYTLPKLDFNFDENITLVHIVVFDVGLHLNLQLHGQLAFGYDTYGLREFSQTHDPAKLLDGFYISDRQNADGTGADVNEFTMHASIGLYGGVDVYLAKAGIEGGFEFDGSINLNDPNNDGKLRVPEMIALVSYTHNPLDLADIEFSGDVYARYYYWVGLKVWTPWHTYTITIAEGGDTFAKYTLFDLHREGSDGPPIFATQASTVDSDGTKYDNSLLINMGPNAAQRISNQDPLNSTDGNESFKIWNDSPGSTTVHVRYLNYTADPGWTETYTNVSRVVADGGLGNDKIDASGLNGLPVAFLGGDGNDTIMLGSGSDTTLSTIDGGGGDDQISVSGGGKVAITGGDGNDSIQGGSGKDTIDPGSGNDTLVGGSAGDHTFKFQRDFGTDSVQLNSGAGTNVLDFTAASSPITANLSGNDGTIISGPGTVAFNVNGVTDILGSTGGDTYNLSAVQTRNANNGQGLLLQGGLGADVYNVNGDNLAGVAGNGITIHDGLPPTTVATLGTVKLCDCGCGGIKSIDVAVGGARYLEPPDVIITDPTGAGARAVAGIDANGKVTGIFMIGEGTGYTNPTATLVAPVSHGDTINYTSATTGAVTLDRQGNGNTDYRISSGGKAINFTGWMTPGTLRPDHYSTTELENLNFTLPAAVLNVNDQIDLQGTFTETGSRLVQNAIITADTVKVTTDRGLQVAHAIDTTNNGDILLRVTGKNQANYTNSFATATAAISGGHITGAAVNGGGNYYDFAPVVTARSNGNGDGATLVSHVFNGGVSSIDVLTQGNSYLNIPAPQVWIAPPASIRLDSSVTSSTVGSVAGSGDGRGRVTLMADAGAINQSGDVVFPTPANVLWSNGDYVYTRNNTLDDITPGAYSGTVAGGSGATATAVIDGDGRVTAINVINGGDGYSNALLPSVQMDGGATATAVVGPDGSITGFHITQPGEGYAAAPLVKIISNGFGKIVGSDAAATTLNRAHIASANGDLVAVGYYGVGDPEKPLKTDVNTLVAQTYSPQAGVSVLEKDALNLGLVNQINGINTTEGNVNIATIVGALNLGAPVQQTDSSGRPVWQDAAKTIPLYARNIDGTIQYAGGRIRTGSKAITKLTADSVNIHSYITGSGGKLVLQPVNPTADIGLNGTTARADTVMTSGAISGFTNFWEGRGYAAAPTVTVTPPGQRAIGFANVANGRLESIHLAYGGTNYNNSYPPSVTVVGGGLGGVTPAHQANVTAQFDGTGTVTGFTITDQGSGYISTPELRIVLPGVQATVIAEMNGPRVRDFKVINPGANYVVPAVLDIATPFPFTFENSAVAFFQTGFDEVVIGRADGRHVFHAAAASSFTDGVTLRSPAKGGGFDVQSLSSTGPVGIVGSGSTTHLTSASPTISGSSVDINDNVIVEAGVSDGRITATDGHVLIFGTGKGKIDGAAGSSVENLTITAATDVEVDGGIGSTSPINHLTVTANTGAVSLNSTTITGNLHITKGTTITLGNMNIGGDLTIDQGATVNFTGSVLVGGNLTITHAGDLTFNGALTVNGDVTISQAASLAFNGALNIGGALTLPQAQSITFNRDVLLGSLAVGSTATPSAVGQLTFSSTARFDSAGTVTVYTDANIIFGASVGHATAPASMTLRSNHADVAFQGSVNVTGTITVIKSRHVTYADDLTAGTLLVQDASGDIRLQGAANVGTLDVTASGLFQAVHALNINDGNGIITANNVDFSGGTGSVHYGGSGAGTLTIKPRTTSRQITIGSPPGVFISLDLSDTDLAAIDSGFSQLIIGDGTAGTGLVTIGSVGSQQGQGNSEFFNPMTVYGGAVSVVQDFDITSAASAVRLVARTGNINVNGQINATATERNGLLELVAAAGSILLNKPIYTTGEIHIDAAGSLTQTATATITTPALRVATGGLTDLSTANNDVTAMSVHSGGVAKFRDDNGFDVNVVDSQTGIVATGAITLLTNAASSFSAPVQGASLKMDGTGGSYTIYAGVYVTGPIVQTATTTVNIGHVTLDSTAGGISLAGKVTLIDDAILASHGGDIGFGSTLDGTHNLTLQPANGNVTFSGNVGGTAALGQVVITSPNNLTMNAFASGGLTETGGGATATFNGSTTVGSAGIQLHAGDVSVKARVTSTGEIHVNATGAVTETTAAAFITPGLRITASGIVDLLAGNNDATVASLKSGGFISFRDDGTCDLATVDGQDGVVANNAITLYSTGGMTADKPVTGTSLLLDGSNGGYTINVPLTFPGSIISTTGVSTTLNNATIDSTTGGVAFNGPVALGTDVTVSSHDNLIAFGGTVDGSHNLTLQPLAANVIFAGVVGGVTPIGNLLITAPHDVTLHALSGNQLIETGGTGLTTFAGAVNIGAGGIALHTVNVTATAVVNSTGEIHIDASGKVNESGAGGYNTPGLRITSGGDADLSTGNNGATTVSIHSGGILKFRDDNGFTSGTVDGQHGMVATGAAMLKTNGLSTISDQITADSVTFDGNAGSYAVNANVNSAHAITQNSGVTLKLNTITLDSAAGGIILNGPVLLTGDATLSSHGGDINFVSTVDGAHNLTLQPNLGNITFTGAVGATTPVGNLLFTSPQDVLMHALTANQLTETGGTGLTTFAGAVNVANSGIAISTVNVTATSGVTTTGEIHIDASGNVTESGVGSFKAAGLRITSAGNTDLSTGDNDTTTVSIHSGGILKFRDDNGFTSGTVDGQHGMVATGAATLWTNGTATISDPITVDSLILDGTGGTYAVNANINSNKSVTQTATVTTQLNTVTVDSLTGGVDFNGPVLLRGDATVASHGGAVTFAATLDGAHNLTLQPNLGNVTFTGAVGATTPVGNLLISTPHDVLMHAFAANQLTETGGTGATTFAGAANVGTGGIALHTVNVTATDRVGSTGEIHIDASGAVTESAAGSYNTPGLRITSAGNTDLSTGNNDTTTVSIHSGGILKFRDDNGFTSGTVDGQHGMVATGAATLWTNGTATISDPITADSLVLDGTGGTYAVNANVNSAHAITQNSGVTLKLNTITLDSAAGGINLNGPVLLTGDATLASHGGAMTFGSTLDGAKNLTLQAGLGNITFTVAVGATTALANLLIITPHDVTLHSVTADQLNETGGTGETTFSGPANLGNGGVSIIAASITVNDLLHSLNTLGLQSTTGNVNLAATADLSAAATLWLTAAANLGVANGAHASTQNSAMMLLTSATITLPTVPGGINGTGLLVLQPIAVNGAVTIGGEAGFGLTQAELDALGTGFRKLLIGRGQAGGFDSGDAGTGLMTIHAATFHVPVFLRESGATGDVVIDGTLAGGGAGTGQAVEVDAGRNLQLNGTVTTNPGGGINLNASVAGLGTGSLLIAQTSPSLINAPTGDIHLSGHTVLLDSSAASGTITALHGSVTIDSDGISGSRLSQVNPHSTVAASGNINLADPGRLFRTESISGALVSATDLSLAATGDVTLTNFRLTAADALSINAGHSLIAQNGVMISPTANTSLAANTAHSGGVKSIASNVTILPNGGVPLGARFTALFGAGSSGVDLVFRILNYSNVPQTLPVNVRIYLSTDPGLNSSALLVRTAKVKLTHVQPGADQPYTLRLSKLPAKFNQKYAYCIVELLPYSEPVGVLPKPYDTGDVNVAVGAINPIGGPLVKAKPAPLPKHKPKKAA